MNARSRAEGLLARALGAALRGAEEARDADALEAGGPPWLPDLEDACRAAAAAGATARASELRRLEDLLCGRGAAGPVTEPRTHVSLQLAMLILSRVLMAGLETPLGRQVSTPAMAADLFTGLRAVAPAVMAPGDGGRSGGGAPPPIGSQAIDENACLALCCFAADALLFVATDAHTLAANTLALLPAAELRGSALARVTAAALLLNRLLRAGFQAPRERNPQITRSLVGCLPAAIQSAADALAACQSTRGGRRGTCGSASSGSGDGLGAGTRDGDSSGGWPPGLAAALIAITSLEAFLALLMHDSVAHRHEPAWLGAAQSAALAEAVPALRWLLVDISAAVAAAGGGSLEDSGQPAALYVLPPDRTGGAGAADLEAHAAQQRAMLDSKQADVLDVGICLVSSLVALGGDLGRAAAPLSDEIAPLYEAPLRVHSIRLRASAAHGIRMLLVRMPSVRSDAEAAAAAALFALSGLPAALAVALAAPIAGERTVNSALPALEIIVTACLMYGQGGCMFMQRLGAALAAHPAAAVALVPLWLSEQQPGRTVAVEAALSAEIQAGMAGAGQPLEVFELDHSSMLLAAAGRAATAEQRRALRGAPGLLAALTAELTPGMLGATRPRLPTLRAFVLLVNLTLDLAAGAPPRAGGPAAGAGGTLAAGAGGSEEDEEALALLAPVLTFDLQQLAGSMSGCPPILTPVNGAHGPQQAAASAWPGSGAGAGGGRAQVPPGGWVLFDPAGVVEHVAALRLCSAALAAARASAPGPEAGGSSGGSDGSAASGSSAADGAAATAPDGAAATGGAAAPDGRRCGACGRAADATTGIKLRKCSGCRTVAYCSTACQHAHWKAGHRRECGGAAQQ